MKSGKDVIRMKKAMVLMAEGFEEVEALTVVDILRRAEVRADMCSISNSLDVKGAQGIQVRADRLLSDVKDVGEYDAVIAPGGLPGAIYLKEDGRVLEIFRKFYDVPGKWIGSICAAPMVLGAAGIASHISGTCYPGVEEEVGYKEYRSEPVVVDKNVVTGMGPALALPFALKITELLAGEEIAEMLREGLLVPQLK